MPVGLGVIFFGVKITYELTELRPIAKFLFGKGKKQVPISAISLMPADLPLRSTNSSYGLLDINSGIFRVLKVNVRDDNEASTNDYVDLVD